MLLAVDEVDDFAVVGDLDAVVDALLHDHDEQRGAVDDRGGAVDQAEQGHLALGGQVQAVEEAAGEEDQPAQLRIAQRVVEQGEAFDVEDQQGADALEEGVDLADVADHVGMAEQVLQGDLFRRVLALFGVPFDEAVDGVEVLVFHRPPRATEWCSARREATIS